MRICIFLILAATLLPLLADDKKSTVVQTAPTVVFSKLGEALSFIDQKLDQDDLGDLTYALYPPFTKGEANRNDNWPQLKQERGAHRLAKIFASYEFPNNGDTFEIHASPSVGSLLAGWSVLTFVRTDTGWCIHAMYGVR